MKHINHKVAYSEPCGIYKAICMENHAFELSEDECLIEQGKDFKEAREAYLKACFK